MSARYNAVRWSFGTRLGAEGGKLVDAHSDDLVDGEQDDRRRHGGCELQHGRVIGRYLGRGGYPAQRIVARAASDGVQSVKLRQSWIPGQLLPRDGNVQQSFSVASNELLSSFWPHRTGES